MGRSTKKQKYDLSRPFVSVGSNGNRYHYTAREHLYAWYQFDQDVSTTGNLSDLSGNERDLRPEDGSVLDRPSAPSIQTEFSNSPEGFSKSSATFNSDCLEHADGTQFSFGDGTNDKPFSVHAWVKPTNLSAGQHLVAAKYGSGTPGHEWAFYITNQGYVSLFLKDGTAQSYVNSIAVEEDEWVHIAATYDGRGGSKAAEGINVYINGALSTLLTVSSGALYVAMDPNTSQNFTIGNADPESNSLDFVGEILEVAVFSKELSSSEMSAIYWGREAAYPLISGVVSSPPRVQIRAKDRVLGSYPYSFSTTGNEGNFSNRKSFDDNNVVSFTSPKVKAEIRFTGKINTGDFIDLTGSSGLNNQRFTYRTSPRGVVKALPNQTILEPREKRSSRSSRGSLIKSPMAAAREFVDAVNNLSSYLRINAEFGPVEIARFNNRGEKLRTPIRYPVVILTHQLSGEGTFSSGNIIRSDRPFGSFPNEPVIKVTQFVSPGPNSINYTEYLGQTGSNEALKPTAGTHVAPELEISAPYKKGYTDSGYTFADEYVLSPFNESKINEFDDQSAFDSIGTSREILEGFESPLRSKTIISLEMISSGKPTPIFFSTGSGVFGNPGPVGTYENTITGLSGSGVAYWNKTLKKWEMIQVGPIRQHTSELSDPFSAGSRDRAQSVLGFSLVPSSTLDGSGQRNTSFKNPTISESARDHNLKVVGVSEIFGSPIDEYGFPNAVQYNATGSQEIRMSNYISSPFLLEKMKVDVEGVFGVGTSSKFTDSDFPRTKVFFVLNQTTNGDSPHIHDSLSINQRKFNEGVEEKSTSVISRVGTRELVAWSKVGFIPANSHILSQSDAYEVIKTSYGALVNVPTDTIASSPAHSCSIGFNMVPEIPALSSIVSVHKARVGNSTKLESETFDPVVSSNDKNLKISGRQIASSFLQSETHSSSSNLDYTTEGIGKIFRKKQSKKHSPYVLMPSDRLVFGWQNVDMRGQNDSGKKGPNETFEADELLDKLVKVKVTLFGSMIRSGKEHHDTLRQNLSTNEIHGAIQSIPAQDIFDVEPIISLSGSTHDSLFFGEMKEGSSGVRGRRASIAKGEAGSTGSLSRLVALTERSEKYSDSIVEPISSLLSSRKFFSPLPLADSGVSQNIRIGSDNFTRKSVVLSNNPISSSFRLLREIGFHNNKNFVKNRVSSINKNHLVSPGGGKSTSAKFLAFDTAVTGSAKYSIFSGTIENVRGVTSYGSPEIGEPRLTSPVSLFQSNEISQIITSIFYAAPVISFGKVRWPVRKAGKNGLVPDIRGYRHGFISTKALSPKIYFRRDSFGQFRDLMETYPETSFVNRINRINDKKTEGWPGNDGPIKVRFFSREGTPDIDPLDTNSQNLSTFSTSSLPFYDGLSTERDVINNPPPDETDVTTLEEAVGAIIDGDA